MKKKFISLLILPLLFGLTTFVSGCNSNYGPDEPFEQLVPPNDEDVVSNFQKDDTDYDSLVEEATDTIRFHYHRKDDGANTRSPYVGWQIWAWDITNGGAGDAYTFTHYDDYGVFVDIPIATITGGKEAKTLGYIVRTEDWSKDPDGDRSFDVVPTSLGGIMHIYSYSGSSDVFYNRDDSLKSRLSTVFLEDKNTVNVFFIPFRKEFVPYNARLGVTFNGEKYTNYTVGKYDTKKKSVVLTFKDDILLTDLVKVSYKFDKNWTDVKDVMITSYFDSKEFTDMYTYTGNDLGATFDNPTNPTKTTFKVWAPTSNSMTLMLYRTGDYINDKTPLREVEMTLGEKGVWSTTVNEDLDGVYYTYKVTNIKGTNEATDPYAKTAGLNGKRGMVINFDKVNQELLFDPTWPSYGENGTDASIYEMHVRDMTINPNAGVSEANRGRFLGLTEKGTTYTKGDVTVTTGLDHLKELGVTHVQILPMYDYNSVDETDVSSTMRDINYNWGYDPQNYNCLEGSYSTNPADGYSRVKEFKKMVTALHEAGININMDVVYNHTGSTEGSNFSLLVPYYYYRTKTSGVYYNGSGCGNEVASERFMVNKFIRESCKFWVEEYGIAGFRFDLMGLLDNQTMIDVYNDCKDPEGKFMLYGEPWTGGTSKLSGGVDANKLTSQKTVQESLAQDFFTKQGNYVGAFNDVIRNAIRGDNAPGQGWVSGATYNVNAVANSLTGIFATTNDKTKNIEPRQVIQYVSCHDNYTLYDQLIQQTAKNNFFNRYTQAETLVFTAQGVPFMQEGEDFMRSKNYEVDGETVYHHNSYNVGDHINDMDYELKVDNLDTFNYFKKLIEVRKEHDGLSLPTRADVTKYMSKPVVSKNIISYTIDMSSDGGETLLVYHAGTQGKVTLPEGNYEVIISNEVTRTETTISAELSLKGNESIVLRKI